MPGMMHRNCRWKCCPGGSRPDDKRDARREIDDELHGKDVVIPDYCPIIGRQCPDDCRGDYC